MGEPRSPKAELDAHGLSPKKHFGQNFLADRVLAAKIAEACNLPGAVVIELGAGMGALTGPLLERVAHVIAVERDRDLVPLLRATFAAPIGEQRLEVLEADAKQIDVEALLAKHARPHVLCGNLPYQITGPLLELAVHAVAALDRVVFLIQLEVAARLTAAPASDDYGALSVFTQAAYDVTRAFVIRRGAFYPQPGVDSAVVVLTPRAERIVETEPFRALVRGAFAQRRKKLKSAWNGVLGLAPARLSELARAANVDLERRGETLSVGEFAAMAALVGANT